MKNLDNADRAVDAEKQQIVKNWNNKYPSGTAVTVALDDGEVVKAETRSEAWIQGADAVILLKSDEHHFSGCWLLERVYPRVEPSSDQLRAAKDAAYKERDMCVALIARMADALGFRVGLRRHEGDGWEDDWRNIVMIDLPPPNGQISWHIHDSEMEWFAWMNPYPGEWDGHDTKEKYRRVLNYFPGSLTDAYSLAASVRRSPAFQRGMAKHTQAHKSTVVGNPAYFDAELQLQELQLQPQAQHDAVNHPAHYNTGRFEVIDVIEDWALGFCLGNAVKYIARAGKKDANKLVEDLSKGAWYLEREIKRWNNGAAPDAHDSIVEEFARTVAENRRLQEQVTELQARMTQMKEESRK